MKVALLGDSIRLQGYGLKVPELLGKDFEVWQSEDNGRFSKYTLRMLYDHRNVLNECDVIHWNNGLWDVCRFSDDCPFSTETEYVENMLRIAKTLLATGAKVIFATTTPVSPKNPEIKNSTVERYNSLIVPELEKLGVIINDLHTAIAADIDRYICDDLIHLSDDGVDLAAAQVTEIIKETSSAAARRRN